MAASRVADRYLVLDHLDVGQPYPFLRLWERWGLGGPPRRRPGATIAPSRRGPRRALRIPRARRHRRPRREDPPASTFTGLPKSIRPCGTTRYRWMTRKMRAHRPTPTGRIWTRAPPREETTEEVSAPAPPPPPLPRPAMYTVDEMRAMGANAPLVPTKRVVSEERPRRWQKAAAAAEVQRRLRELALRPEATPPAALEETPAKEPEHAVEPALVKEGEGGGEGEERRRRRRRSVW